MKNNIFNKIATIAAFSLLIAISGCKKEQDQNGKSTVFLSGTPIELDLNVMLRDGGRFHFYFTHTNGAGRTRLETVIYNIPAKISTYTVNKENISGTPYSPYLFTMDNDLALDEYILLDGEDNNILLTEIDSNKQIVRGTFKTSFIRDTLLSAIKKDIFPDTIRFTEGTFEAPYEKK